MNFNLIISQISRYKYLILFIVATFWTLPRALQLPGSGLDPSWMIGLNIAAADHLQYGKDIVFTLGPYGFLKYPLIMNYPLWLCSVVYLYFVHFTIIFTIYLLLSRLNAQWYHYLMVVAVFLLTFFSILTNWWLLIACAVLLYLILIGKVDQGYIVATTVFAGFGLALGSLMKFDIFFNSLFLIAMFCLLGIILKQDLMHRLTLVLSYLLSFIGLWVLAGQNVSNIIPYLVSGYQATRSYTEAMAINGPLWQLVIGVCSLGLISILFFYCLLKGRKQELIFLVLNASILFTVFKSGYVRHDIHILFFFSIFLLIFAILLVFFTTAGTGEREKPKSNLLVVLLMLFIIGISAAICVTAPEIVKDDLSFHGQIHEMTIRLAGNEMLFNQVVAGEKVHMADRYPLDPSILRTINNSTIDIFPWDIALLWAYDLSWDPRPMIQSQGVYSSYFDDMNYEHYLGNRSPEDILFAFSSVDGRYPLFDEPRTFRSIVHNYSFVNKSGGFILLKRNEGQYNGSGMDLGSGSASMRSSLSIPDWKGDIYGEIDIHYSPLGNVIYLLYKPQPIYIRFHLKNGYISPRFRIIPGLVKNGVLVSQYVTNTDSLARIFQDNGTNDVESISIETDQPYSYEKEYSIHFTGDY